MNLRQKRKHYYHSYKYYQAWWSENSDIYPKRKKFKKYLKKNYKIRREYDFENVSRNYFYFESYCGEMPKFMREKN